MAERFARFLEHFIDELRARPLTAAVLAGEINERNELTAILEAEREQWGQEAVRVLGGAECAEREWLQGLTLLLVAGVQHLLVRSRQIRVFGGVDLQSDKGWDELKRSVRELSGLLFPSRPSPRARPRS